MTCRDASPAILIGLSAVIVAPGRSEPQILATRQAGEEAALPSGAFDPAGHRTFELGLRNWVRDQTGFDLGYVEQLYTFGDQGRDRRDGTLAKARVRPISVGYLGLTPVPTRISGFDADWDSWYRFFPWEDGRNSSSLEARASLRNGLDAWASTPSERGRIDNAFGGPHHAWIEERVLERYELLYEAGLVPEARREDRSVNSSQIGETMQADHRRILATAMGRLRGKIKYRPVIFELMPVTFALSALQRQVEALLGQRLHTQNFRRALGRSGLVESTGDHARATGGRPAELFRASAGRGTIHAVQGIVTPTLRDVGPDHADGEHSASRSQARRGSKSS